MKGVIYIKILNKSKYNIFSIFSCLILVFAFVFGCVQYANAANNLTVADVLSKYNGSSSMYIGSIQYNNAFGEVSFVDCLESFSGSICGYFYSDDRGSTSWGFVSDNPFVVHRVDKNGNFSKYIIDSKSSVSSSDNRMYYSFGSTSNNNILDYQTSILTFSNINDAYNYIDTGEVNNPIYQPIQEVEYDSSVEIPLMAQCQVNGHDYLFNCKQSVPHDDYKLQVAVDLRLTPIYGNFASKQYSDKGQVFRSGKIELGSYDNKGTIFNTSFSTDDLLNGIDTDRKSLGFKEFYQGYNILLPYKEPVVSEVIFYARNVSGNKCSNWVRVTFDLITETSKYEEVESVSGSNIPSDTKTSNSEYYPEDYVYNDNEAYGGGFNASSTLNSLEHNYTQLVLFYKDLFSFLPSEIWALLIGLVSAMVVIALLKYIRG